MHTTRHDSDTIDHILTRGVSERIGTEPLVRRMKNGDVIRVKLGIDPTSPNIHIGRAVALLKLRDFQDAGHTIVLIVGDFTGVIGDTSDKDSERPMLTRDVVEENKKHYFAQAGKLLDLERVELRHNSEWLGALTYAEIGDHANQFSVADFIARENIQKRLDAGKRVSLREVLYPLMQGYDSVAVRADVEVGGTDQRFNMLAGRVLQTHAQQPPQAILTNPLIGGLDGRKMSSSWGNTIHITDTPETMYGKVMSLRDELLGSYFEYCTRLSMEEVVRIQNGLVDGSRHPRDTKMYLARTLVALYHSESDAHRAEESFVRTFSGSGLPDNMKECVVAKGTPLFVTLQREGVVSSKTDWRRLVHAHAVEHLDCKPATVVRDENELVEQESVVRVGKKRFIRIRLEQ